jgi:argininosuccinate lyase
MPQKKNPDVAELVRGRTATVIGDLTAIVTLQKGLPMTYNRDLQEDKRSVFHADDVLAGSLEALGGMIATAEFDPPEPLSWVTALDLAEALVRRGVPFREAHHAVGAVVAHLSSEGRTFEELSADELVGIDDRFRADDLALTDPEASVAARITPGGGSMASVQEQIRSLRSMLHEHGTT